MNKVFGYCRISTNKQSIDRQIRNITKQYPDAEIIKEEYTGRTMERPEWEKLLKMIVPGDTIVFDEVSRMSRNEEEGFETYQRLYKKGINLIFIKEPYIDTQVYRQNLDKQILMKKTGDAKADKLLSGILTALTEYMQDLSRDQIRTAFRQSQKEVDYLRERTREGVETARRNGKQIGQKKGAHITTKKEKRCKPEILRLSKTFKGNNSDQEVMSILHINKTTYYKYKRELKEEIKGD